MNTTPDFAWVFVKMIAGLLLVLGLAIVLIRYILPRTRLGGKGIWGRGRKEGLVSVIDRYPLEPQKNLYLVKVAGRYFLIASAPNSLTPVVELSQGEGEKLEGKT